MRSKAKRFQVPHDSEGFACVHTIRSLDDASRLATSWGGEEATVGGTAGDSDADVAPPYVASEALPQDQVMHTATLPAPLQQVATEGGLAVKNAEHYFGDINPERIELVRHRRYVLS